MDGTHALVFLVIIVVVITMPFLLKPNKGSGRYAGDWRPTEKKPPKTYVSRKYIISETEAKFFRLLLRYFARDFQIFSMVRIADIIDTSSELLDGEAKRAFLGICYKHLTYSHG